MNLAQALVAPRRAALAIAERETKKANPSQALGGIIIPDTGTKSQIIDTGRDPNQLVLYGWKANVWAYTCVKRLASCAAAATWRVEAKTGSGEKDWEPKPDDWRNRLLAYPMGDKLSAFELYFLWAGWLAIKGNGLLRKIMGGPNGVLELNPMTPKNLYPVPDRQLWCSGYNFIEDGKILWNVPAEEVIHARLPDPSDPLWGYGMMEAAWTDIQADTAAASWRKDLYEHGGVPPAAIVDEDLAANAAAEQAAALAIAFRKNARNRVPMLMGGKKTLLEFGFTPSDMQIPEDRGMTRDAIVAAFGMHPAMFSNEASTYDNQDSAIRYAYENGAGELLNLMRDALNLSLLTQEEREGDSVYINFDLSEIPFFRRQREARLEKLGAAIRSGVSRNDGVNILDLGLEDVEGGDEVFIESGLTLLSEAAEGVKSDPVAGFNSGVNPFANPKPDPNKVANPLMHDDAPADDAPPAE